MERRHHEARNLALSAIANLVGRSGGWMRDRMRLRADRIVEPDGNNHRTSVSELHGCGRAEFSCDAGSLVRNNSGRRGRHNRGADRGCLVLALRSSNSSSPAPLQGVRQPADLCREFEAQGAHVPDRLPQHLLALSGRHGIAIKEPQPIVVTQGTGRDAVVEQVTGDVVLLKIRSSPSTGFPASIRSAFAVTDCASIGYYSSSIAIMHIAWLGTSTSWIGATSSTPSSASRF